MADEFIEPGKEINQRPFIECASTVLASPYHPNYSADRAVSYELKNRRSAVVSAIDGMGAGNEDSKYAAESVQKHLNNLDALIMYPPKINQAVELIRSEIFKASGEIKEMQVKKNNTDLDTTVSAAIICESIDGRKRFVVTFNVGDSRIYKYSPKSGEVKQLTKDNSLVQDLVDAGKISKEEAFYDKRRNIITKTVGGLKTAEDIDVNISEIREGDMILAVSDGVTDNITPKEFPKVLREEFNKSYVKKQNKIDLKMFSEGVSNNARIIMFTASEYAKKDDITVSVMRIPPFK